MENERAEPDPKLNKDSRIVTWVVAGFVGLMFAPFLLLGKVFVPGDILFFMFPWKTLEHEPVVNLELLDVVLGPFYPFDTLTNGRFHEGAFPFWNPQIFCGHPLFANGQSALFYLPRLLPHTLLSPGVARTVSIMLHVLASGLVMMAWLKHKRFISWAAGLGGICWMFSSYATGWMEFEHMPIMATCLPLMLLGFDRGLRGDGWRWWCLLVVAGAGSLLGGHLHINMYVGGLVGLYAVFQIVSRRVWRGFAGLALASVGVLGLAAPGLWPILELAGRSQRAPMQFESVTSPLWAHLPTLICPDVWGHPATNFMLNRCQANLIFQEFACYFSVTGLLLALVAFRSQGPLPPVEKRFWGAVAVLSLLAACAFPPYGFIAELITPLSKLIPGRALVLFAFVGSVLAAHGMQGLLEGDEFVVRWLPRLGLATLAGWSAVWTGWVWYLWSRPRQAAALLERWPTGIKLPPGGAEDPRAALASAALENYLYNPQMAVPFLSGLVLWFLVRYRGNRSRTGLVLLLVTGLDLWLFGSRFNPALSQDQLFPETPGLRFLTEQPGLFRVQPRHAAFYNSLMPYGLQLFTGYESMIPLDTFSTLRATQPGGVVNMRSAALQELESPIFDAFNVKYAILPPVEELTSERWQLVYDKELRIYENRKVQPRAYVVGKVVQAASSDEMIAVMATSRFDPASEAVVLGAPRGELSELAQGSPVEFLDYTPDRVTLKAELKAPGLLVVSDTHYPGWEATVNGRPYPIARVNGSARGLYLPEGEANVEFRFRPASFRKGLTLCALVVLSMAVGGLLSTISKRR